MSNPYPKEYRRLYEELSLVLNNFADDFLDPNEPVVLSSSVLGELFLASGNGGENLLDDESIPLVKKLATRLKEIGLSGVVVQVSYPLLINSKTFDNQRIDDYCYFYSEVAKIVKELGLVLIVETSPLFSNSNYSAIVLDYSSITHEEYLLERLSQALVIVEKMKPDYLSVVQELSTERHLTGLGLSNEELVNFAQTASSIIHVQFPEQKVGAGMGAWEKEEILDNYLEHDLDFINFHSYPIHAFPDRNMLNQLVKYLNKARFGGMEVIIGESWLYKCSEMETLLMEMDSVETMYSRDTFSFWEELDKQFIELLLAISYRSSVSWTSLFWTKYLFANLDYQYFRQLSPKELDAAVNKKAIVSLLDGSLTNLGAFVENVLTKNSIPDSRDLPAIGKLLTNRLAQTRIKNLVMICVPNRKLYCYTSQDGSIQFTNDLKFFIPTEAERRQVERMWQELSKELSPYSLMIEAGKFSAILYLQQQVSYSSDSLQDLLDEKNNNGLDKW